MDGVFRKCNKELVDLNNEVIHFIGHLWALFNF